MVEANIIQIALTLIAVAVIGAMKFYERKYGNNPEAWDLQKFGMLVAVAIVVMAVEYLYGNAIAFPAEDIIVPAMALFGTAYTLITGGKLVKNVVTPTVATTRQQNLYDPALNNGKPVADMLWSETQKFVQFVMDDVTKHDLVVNLKNTSDQTKVLSQIAAAEASNEYRYTIQYSEGYYIIQAMVESLDSAGKVRYKMICSASGAGAPK